MTAVLDAPVAFVPTVIPPPQVELPVHLDYTETVRLLFRAVAERGADYVGVGNYFGFSGDPKCLIAQVLAYKGVRRADLPGDLNSTAINGLISGVAGAGIVECDQETLVLLMVAQFDQDRGLPWGDVLAHLDEHVNSVKATGSYTLQVGEYTHTVTVNGLD